MSALRWACAGAMGVLAAMFVVTLQRPDVVSVRTRREKRREPWTWKPSRWRQPRRVGRARPELRKAVFDLVLSGGVAGRPLAAPTRVASNWQRGVTQVRVDALYDLARAAGVGE